MKYRIKLENLAVKGHGIEFSLPSIEVEVEMTPEEMGVLGDNAGKLIDSLGKIAK